MIFRAFPPRKVNPIYGYRSSLSMKNQETWDEANRYSTNLMLIVSLMTTGFQVLGYFLLEPVVSILTACGILVVGLVLLMISTEKHLKKLFDPDGNRKLTE
ncbi:SdpI family protein [Fulvivirgaceae bacterium BMA10]|uniref:SdpI family protein n=2 Tax=Splendidivirga corallicola TaxID=3051826 RepID=A0ABT8KH78_9BACT|nr:SdpI family protein [Fulvivirgaceae bacterium BMA10]